MCTGDVVPPIPNHDATFPVEIVFPHDVAHQFRLVIDVSGRCRSGNSGKHSVELLTLKDTASDWIESIGQIDHPIEQDTIGGKCRRRCDRRSLTILLEGRLRGSGEIESFYSRTIEASAIGRSAGSTSWKMGPPWREKPVKDLAGWAKTREFQPRAPFARSRMYARTASTCPSATSSAAVL